VTPPPGCERAVPLASLADEGALRRQSATEQAQLERRARAQGDPLLDAYLTDLARRLWPEADAAAVRVTATAIRDPALNLFALPGGAVYVHSGVLAATENEAQLAGLLAPELAHLALGHPLALARDGGVAPAPCDELSVSRLQLGPALPLARAAALSGYGADRERAAAADGLVRVARAGLDPRETATALERLLGEHEGADRLEVFRLGDRRSLEPRLAQTRALLRGDLAALGATDRPRDSELYQQRVLPAVRENALLDLRAGRFALARSQLDRVIARAPRDAVAHAYLGDLHRLQAQREERGDERARLLARARAAYQHALALDTTLVGAMRQLGLLYYELGERDLAREAFRRYLATAPDAPDARRIREYLGELER